MKNIPKIAMIAFSLLFASGASGQRLAVNTATNTTYYTLSSVDSVRIVNNLGVQFLTVYTDSVTKAYLLDDLKSLALLDRGKGGIIHLSAGVMDRQLPLESIDSITFADGTVDSTDSDDDGLTDYEEIVRFGTDPKKEDTDGDGWNDGVEVKQFDPTSDPYRFNPLVADLPRIQVVLKSAPRILMVYQTGTSTSSEKAISTATSCSQSQSLSQSFSSSYSQEYGWEAGIEAGYEGEGGKFVVSAKANGSYTTENVYSWGTETSEENSRSLEQSELYAKENNITYTGAILRMSAAVKNTGNIAYTVENLGLTAYGINLQDTNFISPIGALSQQGSSDFSPFTLSPGTESGPFVYEYTASNPDQLKDIDVSGNGIITGVSGFKITMTDPSSQNTIDFTNSATNVAARTANVILDFGPASNKEAKKFNVATLTKYNPDYTSASDMYLPLSLSDIMRSLYLNYKIGVYRGHGGIWSIDGFGTDTLKNGFWFVIITSPVNKTINIYSIRDSVFSMDNIKVHTGETVELVFSQDQDKDGVPLRLETLLGTSDTTVDSDKDSLSDGDEIKGIVKNGTTYRTDPARYDTDNDGSSDKSDPDPLHRPLASSARITKLTVSSINNSSVTWSSTSPAASVTCGTTIPAQSAILTIEMDSAVASVRIDSSKASFSAANPKLYKDTVALVPGNNTFKIRVISEDMHKTDSITLIVPSALQNFTTLSVVNITPNGFKNLQINWNWDQIGDTRVTGCVLVASESDLSSLTISNTTTSLALNSNVPGSTTAFVIDTSGRSSATFTHSNIKFATTYYYKLFTKSYSDGQYKYSSGTAGSGKTTGKIHIIVSLPDMNVIAVGTYGLKIYGSVAGGSASFWSVSSDNRQSISGPTRISVNASTGFDYNYATDQVVGVAWDLWDYWATRTKDCNIGTGSKALDCNVDIVGSPSTTYSGTYTGYQPLLQPDCQNNYHQIQIDFKFDWSLED